MVRKSNHPFAYPLAFLALVLGLLVVENLPSDAKAAAATSQTVGVRAADLADLPLMYE